MLNVRARKSSEDCPLCRSPLAGGGALKSCGKCSTTFHRDCEREFGGGCPTAGCAGSYGRAARPTRRPAPRPAPRQGGTAQGAGRAPERRDEIPTFSNDSSEELEEGILTGISFLLMVVGGLLLLVVGPLIHVVGRKMEGLAYLAMTLGGLLLGSGFALHPEREWRKRG